MFTALAVASLSFAFIMDLGFRIYFAEVQGTLVILLGGGTKKTQNKDIKQAITLWKVYQDEIERYIRDL